MAIKKRILVIICQLITYLNECVFNYVSSMEEDNGETSTLVYITNNHNFDVTDIRLTSLGLLICNNKIHDYSSLYYNHHFANNHHIRNLTLVYTSKLITIRYREQHYPIPVTTNNLAAIYQIIRLHLDDLEIVPFLNDLSH